MQFCVSSLGRRWAGLRYEAAASTVSVYHRCGLLRPPLPAALHQSPSATAKRVIEAQAPARLPDHLMLKSTPEPGFEQVAVLSPVTTEEDTPSTSLPPGDSQSAPLPATRETSESAEPLTPEEASWVVVMRFATVHSGPSVSAPTVRFYSVGAELQLIDQDRKSVV